VQSLRKIKGCGRSDVLSNGGTWKEINIQACPANAGINEYRSTFMGGATDLSLGVRLVGASRVFRHGRWVVREEKCGKK
jgi:hypothetical protein